MENIWTRSSGTWTDNELKENGITWIEAPQGGLIDASMLNSAPTPINPDDAVAATWDKNRKVATIELKDGTRVTYTAEECVAKIGKWDPELNKKLEVDARPGHPSNFAAMYNYAKFSILPGDAATNGDGANEVSADPHEGMVQGYDGKWRWL